VDAAASTRENPAPRRIFPWEGDLTPDHANYIENRVGGTSAVGVFPRGASPYGALDVSGNIYEWCLTKSRSDYRKTEDNDLKGDDVRVVRGGADYCSASNLRCAATAGYPPVMRLDHLGFRVVASPAVDTLDSGRVDAGTRMKTDGRKRQDRPRFT
jgi:formylglycine-generating enzyme required for sulfatase activity